MKDYTVTLDGKTLTLRYTLDDRAAVEELFPDKEGYPGDLVGMVARNLERAGSIKVQLALLWGALRSSGPEWTLQKVSESVAEFIRAGGDMQDIRKAVYRTILKDGAIGRVIDPEPEPAGKDEAPAA